MKAYTRTILFLMAMTTLFSATDGVAQPQTHFNRDTFKVISQLEFDKLVDSAIDALTTKSLSEISDAGHTNIMMCLNTLFMAHDTSFQKRFASGRYQRLEAVAEEKKYTTNVIKVYPDWVPNRGMGFYFPKLGMELYGTPMLYAWYQVEK